MVRIFCYNDFLRRRGRIDFMISANLSDGWYEDDCRNRNPERQKTYSNQAIIKVLQIRYLFGLKLRQIQGFLDWLFEMANLAIKCPYYTTLSKRGKKLNIELEVIKPDEEVNHVSMDSSGIQTYTGNKWLENKHEKNDKGLIVVNSTTEHNVDDRSQVDELIIGINPKEFLAEARYDEEYMYQLLRSKGIKPTIRLSNRPPETKMGHLKTERDI